MGGDEHQRRHDAERAEATGTLTWEPFATSPPTRVAAERERAVARLATAVSVAKSVDEVLSATLTQCRTALDVRR